MLDHLQEITTTNDLEKVLDTFKELISKKYSSLILNQDRVLDVNSMIHLFKKNKLKNLNTFEISLSNFTVHLIDKEINNQSDKLQISRKLFLYGLKTQGRLDIYVKCHVLKQLLSINSNILNPVLPKEFSDSLNTMEKDIYRIITTAESTPFTEDRYMKYVEIFIDKNKKKRETIKEIKKLFIVYQNVNEERSLKFCEKLFIQLLGHEDREIRDEAVKLLNMLYDETNWQEKDTFKDTIIKNIGEQFKFDLVIRKSDFDGENIILISSSPTYNSQAPLNVISWNPIKSKESFNVTIV